MCAEFYTTLSHVYISVTDHLIQEIELPNQHEEKKN